MQIPHRFRKASNLVASNALIGINNVRTVSHQQRKEEMYLLCDEPISTAERHNVEKRSHVARGGSDLK
jgi:hypothetical protein